MLMLLQYFPFTNLMTLLLAVDLYLNSLLQFLSIFLSSELCFASRIWWTFFYFFPPLKLSARFVLTHFRKASPEPALCSEVSLAFSLSVWENRPGLDPQRKKDAISKLLYPLCLASAGWSVNLDLRQSNLLLSSDCMLTCCNPLILRGQGCKDEENSPIFLSRGCGFLFNSKSSLKKYLHLTLYYAPKNNHSKN